MIIYRDLIRHDKLFSDIYKIQEIVDGLCLEVEGKMVSRTEGAINDSLMNHHLQETGFTKEAYKKYIKDYMKSLKDKLEEQKTRKGKAFYDWSCTAN